jgi:hypothetical protein
MSKPNQDLTGTAYRELDGHLRQEDIMSTTKRLLVLAIAVVMAMALTVTATTAAPDCPTPGHWSCTTTSTTSPNAVPGFTCVEADLHYGTNFAEDSWDGVGTRTVTLTRDRWNVCIDLSNNAAGKLDVTVEPPFNGVRKVTANVRDSSPGDHCAPGLVLDLKNENGGTIQNIPKATLNACGTDYSEAHFEGDAVVETWDVDPDVDNPLAIGAAIFGKPGGPVEVTLEFTPES